MARKDKRTERILRDSRAQAGLERKAYFSQPGATPAGWRGGPHTVQVDRKKRDAKRACRGRHRD